MKKMEVPVIPGSQRMELSTEAVTATSSAGEYHMENMASEYVSIKFIQPDEYNII